MPTPPYSASLIARWFLSWASFEEEGALSNLKLQKLLYYAQGHYMAAHNAQPLFSDDIQAWGHGPVVPAVYHEYKSFGSNSIDLDNDFDFEEIDADASQWLAAVWKTFGALSAWRLREMTHAEAPWRDTFQDNIRNVIIPRESMARYFGGLYVNTVPA